MQGGNFLLPDDMNAEMNGTRITMRASPIAVELIPEEEFVEDVQWSRWLKAALDKVMAHVGRVFVCDTSNPQQVTAPTADLTRCAGTVGLMNSRGDSVGALHCIFKAIEQPWRYSIHVVYPNYHSGKLTFEAKVKTLDEDIDVCVLEPIRPFSKKETTPVTSYLDLATDAREGDSVYCFFYPKEAHKQMIETPQIFQKLLKQAAAEKTAGNKLMWSSSSSSAAAAAAMMMSDLPTIINGNICHSEWMQGVVSYEQQLPDYCDGALLVSRSGRVKGIHVKASTCAELKELLNSPNPDELRIAKKLCKQMSNMSDPSAMVPVFVPPHGLVRLLGLEGGSELLEAAVQQNKVQMKEEKRRESQQQKRKNNSRRHQTLTNPNNKRKKMKK
ncbi:hypothetical protein CY35_05G119700 [Sphagnum magellanicum]|nr:hypothetical protein CY35_05G119700 [Sphagnum magellanicum]